MSKNQNLKRRKLRKRRGRNSGLRAEGWGLRTED
jgi:hypothetical protein